MRKYKEVTITRTSKEIDVLTCDLCGAEAKGWTGWDSSTWNFNEVDLEVTVHQKEGSQSPEGGWGTEYVIDLCPACFKERLVPWLVSEGAEIEEKEWDW